MTLFKLKDCEVSFEEDEEKLYYIGIYKDKYRICMSSKSGSIESLESGEYICDYNSENIQEKEEYIKLFPEYHIVEKYIGLPYRHVFLLVRELFIGGEIPSYTSFIFSLERNQSILYSEKYTLDRNRIIDYERIGDKVVAFIEYGNISSGVDNMISYRVGDYEFYSKWNRNRGIFEMISFSDVSKMIPKYYTYKKILELLPNCQFLDEMLEMLRDIDQDKVADALLEILTLRNDYIPKDMISIENPLKESSLICIHSPESKRSISMNTYMGTIPVCTALIYENEWNSMVSIVNKYSRKFRYSDDSSDEEYTMPFSLDIPQMIEECRIIRDLSPDVISFIKEIEDKSFLNLVRNMIGEISKCDHKSFEDDLEELFKQIISKYKARSKKKDMKLSSSSFQIFCLGNDKGPECIEDE